MRWSSWIWIGTLAGGCGPAVGGESESGSTAGATDGSEASSTTDPAATAPGSATSDGPAPTTDVGANDSSSSTGPAPFQDSDVVDDWVCEGSMGPYLLSVTAYSTDEGALEGRVCAPWNDAPDPANWDPCATLVPHGSPPGAGRIEFSTTLEQPRGASWYVEAWLQYDREADALQGPEIDLSGPTETLVVCKRAL